MKRPETIYTASYGFRDSDALGKVWGRTPSYCLAMLRSAISQTGRTYANEYETERAIKDQIWYVGPFAEDVAEIELDETSRANEWSDDLDSLTKGYVY